MIRKSIPKKFGFSLAISLLLSSVFILLFVTLPAVHAQSALVQQNNGGCATTSCSPSPISFPGPVTAGDVVVVAIAVYSGSVGSVGDTFGSTFTLLAEASSSPIDVYIYDATLSSSGSDSIFASFFGAAQGGVYIYEVSGVTTVGAVLKVGGGDCYYYPPPCSPNPQTESASFQSGAFLVSLVAGTDYTLTSVVSTTAGTGFTLSPGSSGGTDGGNAEYATSGVSSPTLFPFTLTSVGYPWIEMGVALAPSGSTSSTTTTTSASISLSPTSGPVGTQVTITGSGFNPSALGVPVIVKYDGSTLSTGNPSGCDITISGTVPACPFTVPTSGSGSHTVQACSDVPGDCGSATFTVTTATTTSTTSTSTSSSSTSTSSTTTSSVPTRAHVSITLNPYLPSNAISANNFFLVSYNDGAQEFAPQQGGTLQIIAVIGSTVNIAATSSGSNAAEQWCLSATSGGTCQPTTILVGASGVSVTYVYYDIQLQFVGYEISGGGTPVAPYFGVYATAPLDLTSSPSARDATITSLPLSTTSYASIWLLAGTVALFEPIINTNPTAASQQWQGVPACDILFVGAINCGDFVSDYQIGPFSQGGVFITIDYHHQYSQQVSFSLIGSGTGYSAPTLNYISAGSAQLLTLTQSASSLFLDAGSTWSVTPNPLAGSTPTNNWTASSGTAGTITGPGTIDPVYVKSVPGQIPANLQESVGVSDTLVPSPQTPLSDSVSISDKYVPASTAVLLDVITLKDTYIAPLTAPLFDSVAVNDYFVSPLMTALNDLVGVGEKLASSSFLAAGGTFSGTIMFTVHSPVNILVTDTLGRQAGFNSTGSMINTIPGAQIIPKNGTQLESIIIPDPLSGEYTIEVFPVNGGGNYTVESQSTNVNGTVVTDTYKTGSVTSSTQYLGVTLSSGGQVTETPPSTTPPFQHNSSNSTLIVIIAIVVVAVAALGSSLFMMRRRRR